MSKKLLVVDDHEVIRLGLRMMLENTDLVVATEATCAAEASAKFPWSSISCSCSWNGDQRCEIDSRSWLCRLQTL